MMFRVINLAAVVVAVVALGAVTAQAGFVSIDVDFLDLPPDGQPSSSTVINPDGNASLNLTELLGTNLINDNGDIRVEVSGETDVDPVLAISKDVTNDTGTTWIGYDITLDPAGSPTFVAGTASSDTMMLLSESSHALSYGLPSPVTDGETVNYSFDILIPTTGDFSFTLTQSPVLIPEPSTFCLALALAGVALAMLKR